MVQWVYSVISCGSYKRVDIDTKHQFGRVLAWVKGELNVKRSSFVDWI